MINPTEIYNRSIEAGEAWSDLDGAANLLEETKKTVKSELMQEYLRKGESAAASESKAEADPKYRAHLESMVEARRLANRAKVKWISVQAYNSLIQTAEATKRAEMNLR